MISAHALRARRSRCALEAAFRSRRRASLAHSASRSSAEEVADLALHAPDCRVVAALAPRINGGTQSAGAIRLQLVEHAAQKTVGGVSAVLAPLQSAAAERAFVGGGVEEVADDAVGADSAGGAELAAHHGSLAQLARVVGQQSVGVDAHFAHRRTRAREAADRAHRAGTSVGEVADHTSLAHSRGSAVLASCQRNRARNTAGIGWRESEAIIAERTDSAGNIASQALCDG